MVIAARPASVPVRLAACGSGLALGAAWWALDAAAAIPIQLTAVDLVLFVLAAGVLELLPIARPSARAFPTSVAVVGAAAMLGAAPPVVALIAAAGWVVARCLDRQALDVRVLLLRAIGGWALAGIAAVGASLGPSTWYGSVPSGTVAASVNTGAAFAVAVAVVIGLPAVETAVRSQHAWRFLTRRIAEEILHSGLVSTAVISTSVLGTLVHPVLGRWTLPSMLVPLLAARLGLERYAVAARAYDQTIRAMSRLPEQLPAVSDGHGVRVADLAADVGIELGLEAAHIAELIRAAHLHELGRIKLERDVPVGQRELALAGASVLHGASSLDRVARVVAAHGDLHSADGRDPAIGLAARIVAACCEVDRYAPSEPGQRHEVVVRLVRDIGDLDVVRALTRVLDRRDTSD